MRRSEERYKLLLESLSDGAFVLDREWRFRVANEAVAELLRRPKTTLLGARIVDLFPGTERTTFFKTYERVMTTRTSETVAEEFAHPDGRKKWYEVRAYPVPEGILCIASDITDRKHAAEELSAYQDQLRSLASELSRVEERERRRIAAGLHDRVTQDLIALKTRLIDCSRRKTVAACRECTQKTQGVLQESISELRNLTFELGSPVLYELGLEAALEEMVEEFQEKHGVESEFSGCGQADLLDADLSALVFRSVGELLANVARHTRARKVVVSVRRDGGSITLTVEDDGVGFDVARAASAAGTTMKFGLFGIRERLDYVGGELRLESGPGRGTRATLLVPLQEEEQEADVTSSGPPVDPTFRAECGE